MSNFLNKTHNCEIWLIRAIRKYIVRTSHCGNRSAFNVGKTIYTPGLLFEEFCEYILPYRRMNGLVIENSRDVFQKRHKSNYFTKPDKDMIDEVDSLLYEYRHLTHSQFWGTQIPVLSASTFEYLRHGLCEHRCWYNSLLFSSLGMAAAVDFVPAWGNRNNNHTWNVLIKDGNHTL